MQKKIVNLCEHFIENRNVVEKVFKLEITDVYPIIANILIAKGINTDEAKLRKCKTMVGKNTGLLSSLNRVIAAPFAATLSTKEDPKAAFDKVVKYHAVIRKHFSDSYYTTYLAVLLADMVSEDELEGKVARGEELYKLMAKKKHPFLTGSDDTVLAVLLSFSEKNNEELIEEMEKCYTLLKAKFSIGSFTQTMSHILSLVSGSPEDKVRHLTELYDMLKDSGRKISTASGLTTLAAVSILDNNNEKLRDTILEIDEYLSQQKGYGVWGASKGTRLMHATMLAANLYETSENSQVAATASTLALG